MKKSKPKSKMKKSKTRRRREKPKMKKLKTRPEVKTTPRPISVNMIVIEPGQLTEHNLSITEEKEFKIAHNGKSLKFDRDDILRKIFAELNWHGGIKRRYAFCRLPKDGKPELIGLDEFDPYNTISAEEADIMLHEGVTMRGVKHLVTKITERGGSKKIWLVAIMFIIIVALVMKSQGMIG